MDKYKDGKMEREDFIKTFNYGFPNRPIEKVERLADELTHKDGKISMSNMIILLYLYCSGKIEDKLEGLFNMFDKDGNKIITLDELYEMMASFIQIAEGKENEVDLAKTMAEMFKRADKNKDDALEWHEFKAGMMEHPLTHKILTDNTLDSLLAAM
jgi:Ca2+-binding EF-hand superfamily protein